MPVRDHYRIRRIINGADQYVVFGKKVQICVVGIVDPMPFGEGYLFSAEGVFNDLVEMTHALTAP